MGREQVVVVGGSVAGLAAAEELRESGFVGKIVVISEEAAAPYDRPPLSKQLLTGELDQADITLPAVPRLGSLEIDLCPATAATRLDARFRQLTLSDGRVLRFDGLILATGSRPRLLPGQPIAAGLHLLRTLDDALALRSAIRRHGRVVIIGAGFIGAEIASSARSQGADVTVLEAASRPLARVLGTSLGGRFESLHRAHGTDLRCGVAVTGIATDAGRVSGVRLGDGTFVPADDIVVGVGATPAVSWLDGSGLTADGAVACDPALRAAPGIYGVGDVARWPHPLFGPIRVEHWTHAVDSGRHAARNLVAELRGEHPAPYRVIPYVWSDQYEIKVQLAGWSPGAGEVAVFEADCGRTLVLFGRAGRLVAVMTWNWPREFALFRRRITAGISYADAVLAVPDAARPSLAEAIP